MIPGECNSDEVRQNVDTFKTPIQCDL
jgi:hypothetical protein